MSKKFYKVLPCKNMRFLTITGYLIQVTVTLIGARMTWHLAAYVLIHSRYSK